MELDLAGDERLDFFDVGDHAHLAGASELVERFEHEIAEVVGQRAEALVDEQRRPMAPEFI